MSIKQLWAPWRMEFITSDKEKGSGCVFCKLKSETNDKQNLILHRTDEAFVILNKYPYNNGHVMVVPNKHTGDLSELNDKELKTMMALGRESVTALKKAYKPEGFNLGMNLGAAGGAGIREHVHLHVVPRWQGDTNFMPVCAETKSMPQHLTESFDALVEHFRRL